jgi:hypothetical protein
MIANRSIEKCDKFQLFDASVTNQNAIREEINNRLITASVCCHSVQKRLPSRLLHKNVKNHNIQD